MINKKQYKTISLIFILILIFEFSATKIFANIKLPAIFSQNEDTYYVDAEKGNDRNNGRSTTTAWKTLHKVSNTQFNPGDRISFRSGQTFNGTLVITSSGKKDQPIIFQNYGGKEFAIIDGKGDSCAVYAYNKSHFEIKNLAITNHRNKVTKRDLFNGIYIVNENAGQLEHIYFYGIKVFDVNSSHDAWDDGKTDQTRYYGGALFLVKGIKKPSWFTDIKVEQCRFENLSRTGLNFKSEWSNRTANSRFGDSIDVGKKDNWMPWNNIIIRNNIFKKIAGNGLIVRVAKNVLIEKNFFDSCGEKISGNAVFNFNTDDVIYQYNEAQHTVYNEGDTDARGIDADYKTKRTIIQYNYLHDNELGGVTATGGPGIGTDPKNFNIGTIIRYNIFENNKRQGAYFSGRVEGLQCYNNVFYADETCNDVVAIKLNKWQVFPNGAFFKNNIFYFKGKNTSWFYGSSTNISFNNNIYFGVQPPNVFPDTNALQKDPQFIEPGTTTGYLLKKSSPALHAGNIISNSGNRDYYGNKLDRNVKPNIGAYNGAGL